MKIVASALIAIIALGISLIVNEDICDIEEGKYLLSQEHYYDVRSMEGPRLTGLSLKIAATLARTPLIGNIIMSYLKKKNDIGVVRRFAAGLDDLPEYYPLTTPSKEFLQKNEELSKGFSLEAFAAKPHPFKLNNDKGFRYWSSEDFIKKYKAKELTPLQVTKAVIAAIKKSNAEKIPLRAVVTISKDALKQAELSTKRWAEGRPIGPLDGVPIAMKDETDLKGHETTLGTLFLGNISGPAAEDCLAVARLRAAGAIVVGKTNMHEIGIGTTGHNPHYGAPRNPHDKGHYPGGSSSGSAAAVAAGLVPIALGADGGGSIRIPAGLCGVVGLKATYKRVPGESPLVPSLAHSGPIAVSAKDAALAYAIIAGTDPDDARSTQPPVHVASFDKHTTLKGLRIGVYWEFFNDANVEVVKECTAAVKAFEKLGAKVVEIRIPHINKANWAHGITILSEMSAYMDSFASMSHLLGFDSQFNVALGQSFSARDFLAAQKVRSYANRLYKKLFEKVDVIITPTSAITAPEMLEDAVEHGESNVAQTTALMKYVTIGNFIGIPAITFPVGYDANGLPVGLQVLGKHWDEDTLLRIAKAAESLLPTGVKKPKSFYYSIIDDAKNF